MQLHSTHSFTPTKPLRACTFRTTSLAADSSPHRSRVSYSQTTRPSQRMGPRHCTCGFRYATGMTPIHIRYRRLGMTADTSQQSLAFRYPVAAVQKNMVLVTKNKSTQTTEGIRKECTGVPYLLSFPQKHIPLSSQVGPHIRLIGCESQAKRARLPITYGRKISKFGLVKEKRFLLSRLHRMEA